MKPILIAAALLTLGGCYTPAPPPETTAETQVQLEEALRDVERVEASKERSDAYWAKLWGEGVAEIRRQELNASVAALVAKAKAEDRAVTDAEIAALAAAHVAQREADAAEIAATIEAAKDPNIGVAKERIGLALDYVTEMTEREKAVSRIRARMGVKAAPTFAPPVKKGTP